LEEVRNSPKNDKYLVLVGEPGVGKSTLVNAAFHGKEGILYARIPASLSPEDLPSALLKAANYPVDKYPGTNFVLLLVPLLKFSFLQPTRIGSFWLSYVMTPKSRLGRRRYKEEVPPLLLIEVESRGTPEEFARHLFSSIKQLVFDQRVARAVIVLSDADAMHYLTPGITVNLLLNSFLDLDQGCTDVLWLSDWNWWEAENYINQTFLTKMPLGQEERRK